MNEDKRSTVFTLIHVYLPDNDVILMETNQSILFTKPVSEMTPQERHERAIAILKRLVADKRQAEKDMVENFHKDPVAQAAVAELKRRRNERGTAAI